MRERDSGVCVAEVDGAALSAWRDGMLPPAEMERMHEHVRRCAACQAKLAQYDEVARTLQRQREIEPGDRIVEAVRRSTAHQPPRRWTPSRRAWGGVSALASVAAVILLFVYVLDTGPFTHLRPGSQATAVPTATSTPAPTIGPAQFTAVTSLQDAWGSHAASTQLTAPVDATHIYGFSLATPDGRKLLGGLSTTDANGSVVAMQAGLLDVATRQFTPVGEAVMFSPLLPQLYQHDVWAQCLYSDERYVVCEDQSAPATQGSPVNPPGLAKLWSYDLVSKQTRLITDTDHYAFVGSNMFESHGTLVFSTGKQVYMVDLATNAIAPLSLPSRGPFPFGFSWPYLVYYDHPDPAKPIKARARDLATGEDIALPQVDAVYAATTNADANHLPDLALTGDTLFVSLATGRISSSNVPPNNVTGPDAATTLYELDNILDGSAQLRPVARHHGGQGILIGANARLVVYNFIAWDRAEDRWVQFSSLPDGQGPMADLNSLNGNTLVLDWGFVPLHTGQEVTIYNTALLRTTGN